MDMIDKTEIKWIDTNQALEILKKSIAVKRKYIPNRTTLIAWVIKYDLGYKYAGRFIVNKNKFEYFIKHGSTIGYKG